MMSASPFSLRPWPTGDKKPKNLGEFVARVNAEPGGFRSVTEAKLREEIRELEERQDDDAADNDASAGDASSAADDDDDEEGDTKDALVAREEFLRNCELVFLLDHPHLLLLYSLPCFSLSSKLTKARLCVSM